MGAGQDPARSEATPMSEPRHQRRPRPQPHLVRPHDDGPPWQAPCAVEGPDGALRPGNVEVSEDDTGVWLALPDGVSRVAFHRTAGDLVANHLLIAGNAQTHRHPERVIRDR